MTIEVEIISREKIKPASPTPHPLKIYKISLLDQIIPPPVYAPATLYFAPNTTNSNNADESAISQSCIKLLKDSLSLALTGCYPFAGVIRDALSVDCNDEGLPFFVAKVKGQIRDFLKHPDMQLIDKFIPSESSRQGFADSGANVAKIQLNCFDCGGIALSIIFAHNIADLTSTCTFLRAWAAIARGCSEVIPLNCVAQSAFPQKAAMQKESSLFCSLQQLLSIRKLITRRYVFDASAISILKAKSKISNDKHPTRVEVVSAFIWKCFMDAASEKPCKPFLLTHPVNLRMRAEPPFPENSFGNFLWLASAVCTNPMDTDLKNLVDEVKKGISRIDDDFVKSLQGDHQGYYENVEELKQGIPEQANWFAFTSWSKIGLYEIDFGWGKPVWLSGFVSGESESMLPNSATLTDTRSGDGIEAWVNLDEKYVAGFENSEELKIYACLNPSVL